MWFKIKWTKICFFTKYYEGKKKPIDIKSAEELGVDIKPRIENIKISEPPTRQKGVMVADVAELVQKLKYEAKVIWVS